MKSMQQSGYSSNFGIGIFSSVPAVALSNAFSMVIMVERYIAGHVNCKRMRARLKLAQESYLTSRPEPRKVQGSLIALS